MREGKGRSAVKNKKYEKRRGRRGREVACLFVPQVRVLAQRVNIGSGEV